jgi:hypothetical protein
MSLTARLTGCRATARLIYLYLTTGARLNAHYQRLSTVYGFGGAGQQVIPTLDATTDFILGPMPNGFGGSPTHEIICDGLQFEGHIPRLERTTGEIVTSWSIDHFEGSDPDSFRAAQMGLQAIQDVLLDPDEMGPTLGSMSNGVLDFSIDDTAQIALYNPFGGKANRWAYSIRFTCRQDPSALTVANS